MEGRPHRERAFRLSGPIAFDAVGSFHIGGRFVTLSGLDPKELPITGGATVTMDPNGSYPTDQMYVQFALLADGGRRPPLLMMHGGGMTGAVWESTPDGRPGWQSRFLEAGYDVYLADAVERGRASWSRYPEIYPNAPLFRTRRDMWDAFRFGPRGSFAEEETLRRPFKDLAFPLTAFDQLAKQCVPRWTHSDPAILQAYLEGISEIGRCILACHSQGCGFAFRAASQLPELVAAIVAIEPGGMPEPLEQIEGLAGTPTCIVWGDHAEADPFWGPMRERSLDFATALRRVGGDATVIDLPARGMRGNSHLPMADLNSDAVAEIVVAWLRAAVSA